MVKMIHYGRQSHADWRLLNLPIKGNGGAVVSTDPGLRPASFSAVPYSGVAGIVSRVVRGQPYPDTSTPARIARWNKAAFPTPTPATFRELYDRLRRRVFG